MRVSYPIAHPPKLLRSFLAISLFLLLHVTLDIGALLYSIEAELGFDMQHCVGQHFVNAGDSLFLGSILFLTLNASLAVSIVIQLSVYFCDYEQILYCCIVLTCAVGCNYYSSSNYVRPALCVLWIPFHLYAMSKTPAECFRSHPTFGAHLWLYSYVYLAWVFGTLLFMFCRSQYSVFDFLGVDYTMLLAELRASSSAGDAAASATTTTTTFSTPPSSIPVPTQPINHAETIL